MAPDLKDYARQLQKELIKDQTYTKAIEIGHKINTATYQNRLLTIEEKREVVRYLKTIITVANERDYKCESANDDFADLVDVVMSIVNGGNK